MTLNTAPEGYAEAPTPLRVYRVARGLSQAQLAELAGVSRETIVRLEGRQGQPNRLTAAALASVLGREVEALFPTNDAPARNGRVGKVRDAAAQASG